MKRRSIGPAYERSPAEQVGEWSSRNILVLLSAVGVAIAFWFIVNAVVDGLFNFLATNGHDDQIQPFRSDDPGWMWVKVIGSIICIFFICKRRAK